MASQDEAFEKALNAMYWSGYWTAIYHVYLVYICKVALLANIFSL